MKKTYLLLTLCLVLFSCKNEKSIQQFLATKTDDPNFVVLDIKPSSFISNKNVLSKAEAEALAACQQIHIAYANPSKEFNQKQQQQVFSEMKALVQMPQFESLIEIKTNTQEAALYVEDHQNYINELVFLGKQPQLGVALVKVEGSALEPKHLGVLLQLLQKNKLNLSGLQAIQPLLQ